MTFLSQRQIEKFYELVDNRDWEEVAKYGEHLLKTDPRDGVGIRFAIMDAYAVLGKTSAAANLALRYNEYTGQGYWGANTYRTPEQCFKMLTKEQKKTFWLKVERDFTFQLAMALWKGGRLEEAKMVLQVVPDLVKQYLAMNEVQIARAKEALKYKIGIQFGTVDEMVGSIEIPYKDQVEFRKAIKELHLM